MIRIYRFVALVTVLATAPLRVALASEPEPANQEGSYVSTTIALDTSKLGYTSDFAQRFIGPWVEEKLKDEHHVPIVDSSKAKATLAIVLSWHSWKDSDWQIELAVERDGKRNELEPFFCKGCGSEDEVADQIFEKLPTVLPWLAASEPTPEPAIDPPTPDPHHEPTSTDDDRPARKLGVLGWVGVGTTVLGGAAIAGGSILASRPLRNTGDLGADSDRFDPRVAGYVTIGLGGAALVAGTTMIIVDVVRRRRKHPKTTILIPTPQGVALVGSF